MYSHSEEGICSGTPELPPGLREPALPETRKGVLTSQELYDTLRAPRRPPYTDDEMERRLKYL
jgi:hypothetical protein